MTNWIVKTIAATLALVVASGCTAAAPTATAPTAITFAIPVDGSTAFLPHVVADKKGFFQKENLNVTTSVTNSTPLVAQGVQGGTFQIGAVGVDSGILVIETGAELVFVGGQTDKSNWDLIVGPDIKSYADLKGKKVGAATLKGGSATILVGMLRNNGLNRGDYELVQAGTTPERVAALTNGAVQGTLVTSPQNVQVARQGYTVLDNSNTTYPLYAAQSYGVLRSWAQKNEDTLLRFLRAEFAAVEWVYDPANRDEAATMLAAYSKVPQDIAVEVLDQNVKSVTWVRGGKMQPEAMMTVEQLLQQDGDLKEPLPDPQKYIDTSYLQKLGYK
jgi:ABC-type nitrate/sulfonate/bicarbonate transport system substrate-binding protein